MLEPILSVAVGATNFVANQGDCRPKESFLKQGKHTAMAATGTYSIMLSSKQDMYKQHVVMNLCMPL